MDSTIIVAFITGVLGPLLLLAAKYYFDKYKKKTDMVTETLLTSERVTTKLDHIKDEFGADRVWLAQFHNGGHFYPTGKSIAKFSIVYETVDINVKSIQNNFQNIPVSLFSRSINQLLENDVIEIPDYKDETIATYGLKYVAEESNCKSAYFFAVKTIDEKFIGIICVEYTKKKMKLDTESINHLTNHATAIGGVLAIHLNKK
jgi:hypothetical protein